MSAPAAYWTNMAGRVYVRWAHTEQEDVVLNALARLHATGGNDMGSDGGKYLGCFRAHGIAVPVWSSPRTRSRTTSRRASQPSSPGSTKLPPSRHRSITKSAERRPASSPAS